jgi:hypothetical protein
MAAYFFSSPVDVDVRLDEEDKRKQVELKLEKERRESCPVYFDGESVVGQVKLHATTLYAGMFSWQQRYCFECTPFYFLDAHRLI